jgi:pimeloyl-ACP methyl ester carboxylesterase
MNQNENREILPIELGLSIMLQMLGKYAAVALLLVCFQARADHRSQVIKVDQQRFHISEWFDSSSENKSIAQTDAIILISGPTDNWNSDSAWFANLAPKLAKGNRVIAIDRAGQVLSSESPLLGYIQFGNSLAAILDQLGLKKIRIVAFASSNISVMKYLSDSPKQQVESVVLIDPDVLTAFSIARYTKDALPFKNNIEEYLKYIDDGKYNQRAKQKNESELIHLRKLAGRDKSVDWVYVSSIFSKRLTIQNLKNTFSEIALYQSDLLQANNLSYPRDIPLTIIDTDFEKNYIDNEKNNEEKMELMKWKEDAKMYYKQLVAQSKNGRYIELTTTEHLIIFSEPQLVIDLLKQQKLLD